nr:GGDEF domain-containing protein [Eubacterium sp.]
MITYFRDILSGKEFITDHIRFEFARIVIAIIHIILLFLFLYIKCYQLVAFNTVSVLFYAFPLEALIRKKNYTIALISTFLEVVMHAFFATLTLGWNFGFSLYNIGLIYVAYYYAYISPTIRKKILMPSILGLISLFLTVMMRLYTYAFGPAYTNYTQGFAFLVSVMNIFIVVLMIMFFASLHTIEIRRKEYELRTSNRKLDQLAHYDALTKLRNRHSMSEELHSILDKSDDDYCFIMCDIDDFKKINDEYGHSCGDKVLKSVASIILNNLNEKHIACRWGGEEILILLKANIEYARLVTEKIRYEIEHQEVSCKDHTVKVTMTFGITPYLREHSFEKCISDADKLLYKGKQTGKNRVVTD